MPKQRKQFFVFLTIKSSDSTNVLRKWREKIPEYLLLSWLLYKLKKIFPTDKTDKLPEISHFKFQIKKI